MAVYGVSPNRQEDMQQLIQVKTNIGGYFFDAFLKLDHSSKLRITEHQVEEGSNIADHSYLEPLTLSLEIGMSDACVSFVEGQFEQRFTRSVSAYDTLITLQKNRIPLNIHTRLKTYKNMLIEVITVPDDYTTLNGLRATVILRELIVVKTNTVSLPCRTSTSPQKTGETNRGTVQPARVEENNSNSSTNSNVGVNSSLLNKGWGMARS